ncbi:hypothetical protein [Neolewinella antarctica]|uniref:Uncharacterized protein n=1 Tax=Neolewinella antarctica TaxID=442734 RepID=A0ABX0X8S4_9BACT|nr:hypothetical protein [Neolewinella antarctica]NJC25658.1 hypothetical protein [Neolewinella antarctica]
MHTPLSRRLMLIRLAQLTAAAAIPLSAFTSCSGCDGSEQADGTPEPYATWERLRAVARSSSDHLPARLAAVAKTGDWRAAYRIVRDDFVTLPGRDADEPFRLSHKAVRAGAYACERSGMGTPVEQYQVLSKHLTAMGLVTEVVVIDHEPTATSFREQLTRNTPPAYDATLSKALEKRVSRVITAPAAVATPDTGRDELRERVFAALPAPEPKTEQESKPATQSVPLLLVTEADGKTYALPLVGPDDQPREVRDADRKSFRGSMDLAAPKSLSVNIQLKAKYRGDNRQVTLLAQEFSADRVAGRHVNVLFDHGYPLESLGAVPIGSLTTFTPVFQVARLPDDPLYGEQETVVGEPFTLFGDEVERTAEGLMIGDIPIAAAVPRPELARRVTEVRIRAHALNYPEVRVDLWATDAAGQPVEGLGPADFSLVENGHPMLPMLRKNRIDARVVIMYDRTTSMPRKFLEKSFYEAFRAKLEKTILAVQPEAKIEFILGNDRYYKNLTDLVDKQPSLIICVSDGKIIGKAEDEHRGVLPELPPVIFIHVLEEEHEDLTILAEFIEVVPLKITEEAAISAEIAEKLDSYKLPSYQFSYYGEPAKDAPTPVAMTVNNHAGSGSYSIQSGSKAPVLEGVYVDVRAGGKTQRFTLGGHDLRIRPLAQPSDADDAFNALLGSTSIYVEGAGPTGSVMVDDLLSARLTTRDAITLEKPRENFTAFKDHLKQFVIKDTRALSLIQGLPDTVDADTLTFPEGLRICVRQHKLRLATGVMESRVSLLPTARWRTVADTPAVAFRQTFDRTWELVRAEEALFEISTSSLLRGQPLVPFASIRKEDGTFAEGWDYQRNKSVYHALNSYGQARGTAHHIVGLNLPRPVWYSVHRETGAVIGILPDLTGGGRSNKQKLLELSKVEVTLNVFIHSAATAGLIPAGAFFALVAKMYMIATAHLLTLEATTDSRCEIHKAIYGGSLDLVVGAITGLFVPRTLTALHGLAGAAGAPVNTSNLLPKCAGFGKGDPAGT